MRCAPAPGGGIACGRGPLADTDRAAVDNFRLLLEEQHRMTEQQPTPAPEPAGVDLAPAAAWVAVLQQIKRQRAELDTLEEAARGHIADLMGNEVDGRLNGVPVVRWSHVAGKRGFNRKQFAKDHPTLDQQYTTHGAPGRRFELLAPGADK